MEVNIFHQYDVRGVYPDQFNADIARRIGNAVGRFLKAQKVVVGEDARISSPELRQAVIEGLNAAGVDVVHVGMCTTPLFYFTVNHLKVDGGIMITASHNPSRYNGLKIMGRDGKTIDLNSGLREIHMLSESSFTASRRGSIENINIAGSYIDFLIKRSGIDIKKISTIKLVIDASNGVAPVVLTELFKRLDLKPTLINFDIDGRFPNHSSDISKVKNLIQLKDKVLETGADIGFAFDGDADRLSIIDEHGEKISADFITGLLFKSRKGFFRKPKVAYDQRFSRSIKEMIGKNGYPSRVGYPFIRAKMREFNADLGGELSGHFSYKEMNYAESAVLAMLNILKILGNSNKKISELVKPFEKYFNSGEINIEIGEDTKAHILEDIKNEYKDGKVNELDGITVEYDDWWFNVRPSNTEPILRLVVEADTKELMENKKEELISEIKKTAL